MRQKLQNEILLQSQDEAIKLLGHNGELRKRIQDETSVRIVDRGARVAIVGDDQDAAIVGELLSELLESVRRGHTPTAADVTYALRKVRRGLDKTGGEAGLSEFGEVLSSVPAGLRGDLRIKARTHGQRAFLEAVQNHDITIVVGPAGTGKTFLAMAAAVSALLNKEVGRLVLTRPTVEAGESLGFLPGDVEQKVNPYLRPLYDALYAMVDVDRGRRLVEAGQVEVAPLAFMRGRTLAHAFAILDEAQNTTSEQMKMFLTRFGQGSKAVVTGDITQVDLPKGVTSGLMEAQRVFCGRGRGVTSGPAKGVAVVKLTNADVVRHPLVQDIVDAYEVDREKREEQGEG